MPKTALQNSRARATKAGGQLKIIHGDEVEPAAAPARSPRPAAAAAAHDGGWLMAVTVQTAADAPAAAPAQAATGARGRGGGSQPSIPPDVRLTSPITAIGLVRAEVGHDRGGETLHVAECRAGGNADSGERVLLGGFWFAFEQRRPTLVTYGGHRFLLPLLRLASMRHGLTANWLHTAGDRTTSYASSGTPVYHADMQDILSARGDGAAIGIGAIARAVGVPHHPESDPRARVEIDAATLFLLYIRWRLYTGHMTRDGHDAAADSLRAVLADRVRVNAAMQHLLDRWPKPGQSG